MAECFYCEKDNEKRKALMLDVCELPYSIVYLFRDQKNKGRCVVAFKGHKTEYFQLTPEENAGYFADARCRPGAIGVGRPGFLNQRPQLAQRFGTNPRCKPFMNST